MTDRNERSNLPTKDQSSADAVTNQAAIIALFRVMNRYVGNLPPMPGVFPDYPAPAPKKQFRAQVEAATTIQ